LSLYIYISSYIVIYNKFWNLSISREVYNNGKRHTLNYEDDIQGKKQTKKMQAGMLASKHVFNI